MSVTVFPHLCALPLVLLDHQTAAQILLVSLTSHLLPPFLQLVCFVVLGLGVQFPRYGSPWPFLMSAFHIHFTHKPTLLSHSGSDLLSQWCVSFLLRCAPVGETGRFLTCWTDCPLGVSLVCVFLPWYCFADFNHRPNARTHRTSYTSFNPPTTPKQPPPPPLHNASADPRHVPFQRSLQ